MCIYGCINIQYFLGGESEVCVVIIHGLGIEL
jgi:hypothetical protein